MSPIIIKSEKTMMRIKYLIFSAVFLLAAAPLLLMGCARYRDVPPGTATEIKGSGFEGVGMTDLQKVKPGSDLKSASPVVEAQTVTVLPPAEPPPSAANSLSAKNRAANTQTAAPLKAGPEDSEFATLMPFGHEFFRTAATTAAGWDATDRKSVPVPMQYRVGPKDKINLVLGGNINARYELTVDGNGRINIPRIGSVFVAGMTFEEMSKQVIKKSEETAGMNVNISMNALKTILVSVRGEVRWPGPCTVGSFSTITDALLFAGGPKETGSVRNVQVRRKGITVASFDLYDLLLKGFKLKNIMLMEGDEVFVPVKGPEVGITGSVRRPAVYELKDRYDLENLIGLAGGVIPATEAWRIQIERIAGNERKVIYDVSEQDLNLKKSVPPSLRDRDLVRISPLAERSAAAAVHLNVNVVPPGEDEIKPEMKPQRPLLDKTYPSGGGEGRKPEQAAVLSGQNVPAGDSLKFVTLSGEFNLPGRYPIQKGEKLSSVIERAGGYTNNAYLRGAYFTRESVRLVQQQNLNDMAERLRRELFPPGAVSSAAEPDTGKIKAMQAEAELKQRFVEYMKSLKATGRLTVVVTDLRLLKGSAQDIEMENGDNLDLPQKSNVVNVAGSVMTQGSHLYSDRLDYQDYIDATGGYAQFADPDNVFIMKVDGSARKISKNFIGWSSSRSRWEMTAYGGEIRQIESGDVIVVPEKLTHIAWLKQIRDINQLLMNTAVLTGTALRLW
jgi:protein involved in polysaccharide export with SLBB domain